MNVIEIQPVIDILALSLQSAFVSNEVNGVNLLFIGKPETAKTTTIFFFNKVPSVAYYDEITQKRLLEEFLPDVRRGIKKSLLIPDLINCIEKQKSTRDQFLNTLKSGIDDTGLVRISTPHKQLGGGQLDRPLRFNLITAITQTSYGKVKTGIRNSGLLSRFIPFTYDYPITLVKDILKSIEGTADQNLEITVPKIIETPTEISNSPQLFKEFEIISSKLGGEYGGYGFRGQVALQRLTKANALINNRTEVLEEDVKKVVSLAKWINLDFNSIV